MSYVLCDFDKIAILNCIGARYRVGVYFSLLFENEMHFICIQFISS